MHDILIRKNLDDYYRLSIVLITNTFCSEGTCMIFLKTYVWYTWL